MRLFQEKQIFDVYSINKRSRNVVIFILLAQRGKTPLQVQVSFMHVKVPYRWVISILFAELVLCLLFLQNNQFSRSSLYQGDTFRPL